VQTAFFRPNQIKSRLQLEVSCTKQQSQSADLEYGNLSFHRLSMMRSRACCAHRAEAKWLP
jgi:hypothetical protein